MNSEFRTGEALLKIRKPKRETEQSREVDIFGLGDEKTFFLPSLALSLASDEFHSEWMKF